MLLLLLLAVAVVVVVEEEELVVVDFLSRLRWTRTCLTASPNSPRCSSTLWVATVSR